MLIRKTKIYQHCVPSWREELQELGFGAWISFAGKGQMYLQCSFTQSWNSGIHPDSEMESTFHFSSALETGFPSLLWFHLPLVAFDGLLDWRFSLLGNVIQQIAPLQYLVWGLVNNCILVSQSQAARAILKLTETSSWLKVEKHLMSSSKTM